MNNKPILVPVDLTETSPVAMGHACHIAQQLDAPVHVLHLVKKESQVAEGEARLSAFLELIKADIEPAVTIQRSVKVGDILKQIGDEAEELNARLVIIGTHGLQGLEYLVGTHAIRIIKSASVPFIVVQEKPIKSGGYNHIIVPIELESEGKQKLEMVANMARLFDSTVHLVLPFQDDEFLRNTQSRNLNYAKGFFKEHQVSCSVTETDGHEKHFDDATIKAAIKEDGDLIAIMNFHELSTLGLFGSDTQDILINKAMIPVLVMNPSMLLNYDMFRITS